MRLKKILKNLKKGLVITAGFVLPSLGIGQTAFYGDQVLNPGAQPNVKTGGKVNFDYYGSGDVDGNDTLDWNDYALMNSNIQNDRTDINGNGVMSDANDKQLLYNLLNGQTKYLPGHWDLLQTKAERESWLTKMLAIDSTDLIPWSTSFDCDQFTMQTLINFAGIENISNSGIGFTTYDTTKNGRFNIPMYDVSTKTSSGGSHAINGTLTGDSVPKFSDFYFTEPQNDSHVVPGNWSMNANSYANLRRKAYLWNNIFQTFNFYNMETINFNLTNGNASITLQAPNLVTTRHIVPVNPTATLPGDTLINYQTNLSVDPASLGLVPTNVSNGADWFVSDSSGQIMNGGIEQVNYDIYRTFTLKPWHKYTNVNNVVQKEYPYHWLSTVAGVDTIKVRDIEKPIYVSFPVGGNPVVTDNSGLSVVISYTDSVTQDTDTTKCGHYTYNHIINWTVTDVANNSLDSSVVENIMKPNQLAYDYVPNDTIVPKNGDTSVVALGSAQGHDQQLPWYNTSITYKDKLIESDASYEKYERTWTLEDICGNQKDSIQYITRDLADGIDEYSDKAFEKLYPNPTKGRINIELAKTYKNVNVKVRNTLGQLVLTKEFRNTNLLSLEIGNVKGMYFVETQTLEGTNIFKVIKE